MFKFSRLAIKYEFYFLGGIVSLFTVGDPEPRRGVCSSYQSLRRQRLPAPDACRPCWTVPVGIFTCSWNSKLSLPLASAAAVWSKSCAATVQRNSLSDLLWLLLWWPCGSCQRIFLKVPWGLILWMDSSWLPFNTGPQGSRADLKMPRKNSGSQSQGNCPGGKNRLRRSETPALYHLGLWHALGPWEKVCACGVFVLFFN